MELTEGNIEILKSFRRVKGMKLKIGSRKIFWEKGSLSAV